MRADKSLGKTEEESLKLDLEAGQEIAEERNRSAGRSAKP